MIDKSLSLDNPQIFAQLNNTMTIKDESLIQNESAI